MKNSLLGSVAALGTLLLSTQASALGPDTTTSVRCWYKESSSSTQVKATYEWALAAGSSSSYKLGGKWFDPSVAALKNMFYTATAQATIKSRCADTLNRKRITQPLVKMSAGKTGGLNYTIWTQDLANQPAKINKVVVFGDSVSDNGNLFEGTQWTAPNRDAWYLGHFTNGRVWDEYLSDNLSLPNYNWAVGGAAGNTQNFVVPGIVDQVNSYLKYMQAAANYKPENSLFTVLIGANDIINYNRNAPDVVADEQAALDKLITSGARNIIVVNLPDLTQSPQFRYFKTGDETTKAKAQILDFNARQLTMLAALRTKWGATLNLKLLDVNAKVADMLANPATYNITNTTDSCLDLRASNTTNYFTSHAVRAANNAYGQACTNGDAFLFWDLLHPSTHAHKVIGDLATSLATAAPRFPL